MHKAHYRSHTDPLFKRSGILKLNDIYEYETIRFMHDYYTNNLPKSFRNIFKYNYEFQGARITRQYHLLYVPRCSSNFASKFPIFQFPHVWNRWYDFAFEIRTRSALKKHMKSKLLDKYLSNVNCKDSQCPQCYNWLTLFNHKIYSLFNFTCWNGVLRGGWVAYRADISMYLFFYFFLLHIFHICHICHIFIYFLGSQWTKNSNNFLLGSSVRQL